MKGWEALQALLGTFGPSLDNCPGYIITAGGYISKKNVGIIGISIGEHPLVLRLVGLCFG